MLKIKLYFLLYPSLKIKAKGKHTIIIADFINTKIIGKLYSIQKTFSVSEQKKI